MKALLKSFRRAMAAFIVVLAVNPTASAEGPQTYKIGDRVEADPMLLGQWRKGTVVKIHMASGRINGYEVRVDPDRPDVTEEYTVGTTVARGIRPLSRAEAASAGSAPKPATEPAMAVRQGATASCSSDPALTAKASAADTMELSYERAILSRYQRKVEEKSGLSAPLAVGIHFEGLQIGTARPNRRTLDRLDGSYIREAPVGGDIYPVKTKFTVCERYANDIYWTDVDGRYECFRDNFGEWACGNSSGWRTLDTRRERIEAR